MPGILDLYVTACHGHIDGHRKQKTMHEVSRAVVEFTILTQLDKAKFPMEYKAAWYHAVLHMDIFESLWKSMQVMYQLSDEQLERFVPDEALLTYEVPRAMAPIGEEKIVIGEETSNEDDEQKADITKKKRVPTKKKGARAVKVRVRKGGAVGK